MHSRFYDTDLTNAAWAESGRFSGVKPLSWLALEGGNTDTSTGRCSPTPRRARGFWIGYNWLMRVLSTRLGLVRAAVASFSSAASSPHPRGDGPRALLILREYLHGCWGCMKLTTLSSLNLLFEISMQIREKRLSPRPAPGRPLLPLSPKRTQVRLKSLL